MDLKEATSTCLCGEDFDGVPTSHVGDELVTYLQQCDVCDHKTIATKKRKVPNPTLLNFHYLAESGGK